MTIRELRQELFKIEDQDAEVLINVRDYYGVYGYDASINIQAEGGIWTGIKTNSDTRTTRIDCHILPEETFEGIKKQPKVTFRK